MESNRDNMSDVIAALKEWMESVMDSLRGAVKALMGFLRDVAHTTWNRFKPLFTLPTLRRIELDYGGEMRFGVWGSSPG